jgi:hypothetical protein
VPFADDLRDLPAQTASTIGGKEGGQKEESSSLVDDDNDNDDDEGDGAKKEDEQEEEEGPAPQPAVGGETAAAALQLAEESVTLSREKVRSVCNPVLQKQYHMLQALALDQSVEDSEWSEEHDDELRPSPAGWAPQGQLLRRFVRTSKRYFIVVVVVVVVVMFKVLLLLLLLLPFPAWRDVSLCVGMHE